MKFRNLFLLASLALAGCMNDGPPLTDTGDEADAEGILQEEVARIVLEDGEIQFLVDVEGEEVGGVTIVETARPDKFGNVRTSVSEGSALEIFLAHTDISVPVPTALIDEEVEAHVLAMAAERDETNALFEPVASVAPVSPAISYATPQQMCNEGGTSSSFYHQVCQLDEYWTRNFCHNGTWTQVTDTAGLGVEWTRARTLACGGSGKIKIYYRGAFTWRKNYEGTVARNHIKTATQRRSTKRNRRITHVRKNGFVRGASDFLRFPF